MTKRCDPAGRFGGILFFLFGVALLAFVFKAAYAMLASPVPELDSIVRIATSPTSHAGQTSLVLPAVAAAVLIFICKLALLFVLVSVGSIASSKGIHLYFTALSSPLTAVTPSAPPPADSKETPDSSNKAA